MFNSYNVVLAVFLLVTAVIVTGIIYAAFRIRPRKTVSIGVQTSGVQTSFDGTTHIIPGEGHVEAEDCMCHPRVDGLHGELFVEHRPLPVLQRGDCS